MFWLRDGLWKRLPLSFPQGWKHPCSLRSEVGKVTWELRTEAREETVGVESCIFQSVQLGGWRDPFNEGSLGIRLGRLHGRAF